MNYDKLIFSIAYNMTSDYETTRDVVQDINLKFLERPISEKITDKRNYVIKTTINHCLNLKKKQKRIQYTGTWLPEPIATEREMTIHHSEFEEQNLLCYELAFLMEQLTPTERAVFVLRNAFDFEHKEIAEAINITQVNSRKLLSRAKEKVTNFKHKNLTNPYFLELAQKFIFHINQGNINELISLFNDDIYVIGDGGGKGPATLKPIIGKDTIAQFYIKLFNNKNFSPSFSFTEILSQPAIIIQIKDEIICIQILSIYENKISRVFAVTNPDKINNYKLTLIICHES